MLLEAAQALKSIFDRVDPLLKDDLLGGMLELLAGEPAPVCKRPMAAAAVDPAVPQQEGEKLLALSPKIVPRRLAGAHKIPDRLMSRIGRPDPYQFAGTMQTRQRNRIPTVRLDPLARSFRDQCRSDHHAIVAERLNLAIEPISRRPGLEADMQLIVPGRQSLDRPLDRRCTVLNIAEKPNLSRPASFGDRNGVLPLSDVKSHENFAMLSHGPPSVHEARLGMPEQPSFLPARKGGPPARAREHDVYRRVLTEPLVVVFPSDHRLATQVAVELREIVGETFIIPSNTAPTLHSLIAGYLERSGLGIKPVHEVDHLAHAVSMVASTGAVMLLPAYARNFLPWSVTSRPLRGKAPTIDLVVGYNKANRSPILKLFLSRLDEMAATQSNAPPSPA